MRIAIWSGQRVGTVYLLQGRTEYIEKYGYVIQRLLGMGLNVVAIDFRGQGLSDRPKHDPLIGHVADFSEYQQDIAAMLAHPRVQAQPGPRVLMCHSMGGCIGLRALIEGLDVHAAVFGAPMWAIHTPLIVRPFTNLIVNFMVARGKQLSKVLGTSKAAYVAENKFEGNLLTSDRDHWDMMRAHVENRPELRLGGPSYGWIKAATRETQSFDDAELPDIPTLIFQGSQEKIVSKPAIASISERMPNARLEICPDGHHEVWMETKAIQDKVWTQIKEFLNPLW